MNPTAPRRRFVRLLGATGLLATSAAWLQGCGSDGDGQEVVFAHGVASGDPLADRVILWTRATPRLDAPVELVWQVADDAGFARPVRSGTVRATPEADFTAKVDVTGLAPGRTYFYRFGFGTLFSSVGRTRTLPAAGVAGFGFRSSACWAATRSFSIFGLM